MLDILVTRMRSSLFSRGAVAQLGEHLLCKQGVVGSNPSSSTIFNKASCIQGVLLWLELVTCSLTIRLLVNTVK